MIHNCKEAIQAPGKLWEQDKSVLLGNLEAAVTLYVRYQQEYQAKAKVSHQCNTALAAVVLCFLPEPHFAGQAVRHLLGKVRCRDACLSCLTLRQHLVPQCGA